MSSESNKVERDASNCNREEHKGHKIQYVCLEQKCILDRLLCKKCVNQNHRKHKVGIIDKVIQPLNRLNMNCSYQNSLQDFAYLKERYDSICIEWQKLSSIFHEHMNELRIGILFQLKAIMQTFSNDDIDDAYDALLTNDTQIERINEIVTTVNFLNKEYLQDVEEVKKYTEYITERTKRHISKTVKKIQILLKKMQAEIKKVDFCNYNDYQQKPEIQDQSINKDEKLEEPSKKQQKESSNHTTKRDANRKAKQGEDTAQDDTSINSAVNRQYKGTNMSLFGIRRGFQKCK